jgi:hypothetical protein
MLMIGVCGAVPTSLGRSHTPGSHGSAPIGIVLQRCQSRARSAATTRSIFAHLGSE